MKHKQKVVVLLDVTRAYDRDISKGITHFNKIHDKFIFFFFSPKYAQTGNQAKLKERLIDWKPDGILTREIDEYKLLLGLNIPLIIFPHTNLYDDKINVWVNNKAIGEIAADYFISKGYTNHAFLGFKDFQWSIERQQGYIERIREKGYYVNTFIFDNAQVLWESLPARLTEWLGFLQKPCV